MDFDFPAESDPRRKEVRDWVKANPKPTARQLLDSGYEVPHWPRPYGLSADPELQLIIDEELEKGGIKRFGGLVAQNNCGPSLLTHGTPEAKARYLEKGLMGEERWCQLFSEPSGGSDLASLRTTATREGDEYIIRGQKIWTSGAHECDIGFAVVRTDPHAAKHAGLSAIIIPLKNYPGVTIRTINDMSGREGHFNEVFFDEVRVPATNLLGEEGDGWRLTMQMLQSERLMIARVGNGPSARTLVQGMRKIGKLSEAGYRDDAAKLYIEGEMIRLLQMRNLSDQLNARRPGPEAAAMKMLGAPHIQKVLEFSKRIHGQGGLVENAQWYPGADDHGDDHGFSRTWDHAYWFSPAMTLMVGTQEIMRNVIGERVLGLPRELDPSAKGDWSEMSKKARLAAAA